MDKKKQRGDADHRTLMGHVYDLVAEMGKGKHKPVEEVRAFAYALGAAIAILYRDDPQALRELPEIAKNDVRLACDKTTADLDVRRTRSEAKSLGHITQAKPARRSERDHAPRVE